METASSLLMLLLLLLLPLLAAAAAPAALPPAVAAAADGSGSSGGAAAAAASTPAPQPAASAWPGMNSWAVGSNLNDDDSACPGLVLVAPAGFVLLLLDACARHVSIRQHT